MSKTRSASEINGAISTTPKVSPASSFFFAASTAGLTAAIRSAASGKAGATQKAAALAGDLTGEVGASAQPAPIVQKTCKITQ